MKTIIISYFSYINKEQDKEIIDLIEQLGGYPIGSGYSLAERKRDLQFSVKDSLEEDILKSLDSLSYINKIETIPF